MRLDISQLRTIAQQRDRYQTQLSRLKAAGKQTSCIEAAVSSAFENLSGKTTSFVIYGEPQSGKTEMMICLTAKLLDSGHRVIVHLLNDSVQLLQQNLDRFQRSKLSPAARNFAEVIDPGLFLINRAPRHLVQKKCERPNKAKSKAGKTLAARSLSTMKPISRRLPPPTRQASDSMDARMRREVILSFVKP